MKKLIASSLVITSLLAGGLGLRPVFADSCCKSMTNAATSKKCADKCEKETKSSSCCKKSAKDTKGSSKTAVRGAETSKEAPKH
jgi:hypothetical protein